MFAWVALFAHITRFIAGASAMGASVARQSVANRSSARPSAKRAMKSALAGATNTISAQRASSIWPMAASAALSHRSVPTGRPETAWKLIGRYEIARRGHDDLDVGAALDQAAHQIRALVGGDAAGDPQQDASFGRQWMPFSSLKRAISLSNCSRMFASSVRFC